MMRKKVLTLAVFVGATLLLTATGVLAASPAASNPHPILQEPTAPPAITATTGITNPVATLLAAYFDRTLEDILAWHDEGLGYGEIAIALFLAQSSGQDVNYIISLHQEGLGWGEIAKTLDLAPGNRDRNLGAIVSGRGVITTTYPAPAEAIAGKFGVPITDVLALHEEGFNWGDIRKAFALSQESGGGKTPEDILSMHQDEGMSWGEIRKALGLIPENPGAQNQNTEEERVQNQNTERERIQNRENNPGRGRGK